MKSPLRYIGGKSRALKYIMPLIPNDLEWYVEPFLGGGSVGIAAIESKKAQYYHLNDFDRNLINFFKCIDDQNLCREVQDKLLEKLSLPDYLKKSTYYSCRTLIQDDWFGRCHTLAAFYFFVNRCSFSGTGSFGGFSLDASKNRFTKKSIEGLSDFVGFFKDARFTCQDYKETLYGLDKDCFIFADPPYCLPEGKNKLYKDHSVFDHKELAEHLNKSSARVMITYNKCEEILNLYKGWNVFEYSFKYGSSKDKDGQELILRNY